MSGTIVIIVWLHEADELHYVVCFPMDNDLPDKPVNDYNCTLANHGKYELYLWNRHDIFAGIKLPDNYIPDTESDS